MRNGKACASELYIPNLCALASLRLCVEFLLIAFRRAALTGSNKSTCSLATSCNSLISSSLNRNSTSSALTKLGVIMSYYELI